MSRTNNKNIYVSLDGSTFTNIIASGSFSGDGSGLTGVISTVPQGTISGSSQLDGTTINNLTGSFTGSFIGDGSGLTGLGALTLPPGVISGSSQLDGTTINGLSGSFSGSFQGDGSGLTGITSTVPQGTVSGSSQVNADDITNFDSNVLDYINTVGVISGSVAGTDITQLNLFTSSIQIEVDGISSQTSSYLTTLPIGLVSGSDQVTSSLDTRYTLSGSISPLPSGVVSGSSQISYISISDIPNEIISGSSQLDGSTFTNIIASGSFSGSFVGDGSQLSGVTSYTDADTLDFINSISVLSGSKTDITSLNTFTSSIQSEVDGLSAQTSSYLTSLPSGLLSGSKTDISSLNSYTSSNDITNNLQNNRLSQLETVTGSLSTTYEQIASGTHTLFSGSSQVNADTITNFDTNVLDYINSVGVVSGSISGTDITSLNNFTSSIQSEVDGLSAQTSSYLTSLPDGVVSGSSQVFITSSQVTDYTTVLAGTSNTTAFTPTSDYHPATKIYVDNSISASGGYTDEQAQDAVGSILTDTPTIAFHYDDANSLISASAQGGIVSGSSQIVDILGSLNTFSSSVQAQVDGLSAQTSSYLTSLPTGLVSGSNQLTGSYDLRYTLSGSISPLPDGVVSGSSQISFTGITNVPSGLVSGSNQLTSSYDTRYERQGRGIVSGSSQLTGSYDIRYALSGSTGVSDYTQLTNIPAGIVSGSDQLSGSFERISSGTHTLFSGSSQVNADDVTNFDTNVLDYINTIGVSSGSHTDISSLNNYTASNDTTNNLQNSRLSQIETVTASLDITYEQIASGTHTLVSGSSQLTGSYDLRYTLSGSISPLPDGVVSGSSQINYPDISNVPGGIVSSSSQLDGTTINGLSGSFSGSFQGDGSGLTGITSTVPPGTVSGSSQLDGTTLTNVIVSGSFSGSYVGDGSGLTGITSTVPQGTVSGSQQITAFGFISESVPQLLSYTSSVGELTITDGNTINLGWEFTDTVDGFIFGSPDDKLTVLGNIEIEESAISGAEYTFPDRTGTLALLDDFVIYSGSFSGSVEFFNITNLPTLVSGSSQINYPEISNIPDGIVSGSSQLTGSYDLRYTLSGSVDPLPDGTVSGSSQINYPDISNIPSGIVSGSSQLDGTTIDSLNLTNTSASGSFSGSFFGDGTNLSGVTSYTDADTLDFINSINVVSGSSQLTGSYDIRYELQGSGIFSGSSQVNADTITNFDTNVLDYINTVGVTSGSHTDISSLNSYTASNDTNQSVQDSRLSSLEAATSSYENTLTFNDTTTINLVRSTDTITAIAQGGIISGSSQVSYVELSNIPGGIVSGSSQLTPTFDSRYELQGSGIISGSDQLSGSYDTRYELQGSGIFSGSSQVNADTITNFDTNVQDYINTIGVSSGSHTDIGSLNSFTSSIQTEVDGLSSQTSSYLTSLPDGIVSGSSQLDGTTIDNLLLTNVIASGSFSGSFVGDGSSLTGITADVPQGTVSGSSQLDGTTIDNLLLTNVISSGSFSGSFQGDGSNLTGITADVPQGTVSGSQQITAFGFISESVAQLLSYTSSVGELTITDGNTINLGWEFDDTIDGFIFGSPDDKLTVTGNIEIEEDTVSGSEYTFPGRSGTIALVSDFAIYSGSFSGSVEFFNITNLPTLVSGSSQISFLGISNVPGGIVSGSSQLDGTTINNLLLTNTISSGSFSGSFYGDGSNLSGVTSYTDTDTLNFINSIGVVSGSTQLTASLDLRYTLSGSISPLPDGVISGSSQVSFTGISNVPSGLVSGSSQVTFSGISGKPSGLVSGSSQLTSSYDTRYERQGRGIVSGSSQLTSSFDTRYLNTGGDGVISGSSQVSYLQLSNIPSGIISSSAQVNANTITNFDTNVLDYINSISVLSGSASGTDITQLNLFTSSIQLEVDGLSAATSSYEKVLTFNDTTTINFTRATNTITAVAQGGLVSGSSQVSFTTISNKPSGLVSGSSQIIYSGISSIPSGIVSGSTQVKSLLPQGTVSGSTQITTVGDHGPSGSHQVVNVVYGVSGSTPPSAASVTEGTLFIQYIA